MQIFCLLYLFCNLFCSFAAGNPTEKFYVEVLVVVDETLNNKTDNITEFVSEFFGFVNVIFDTVDIEIAITDIFVENQDGVDKLPFIHPFDTDLLDIDYDIGGVSLARLALWRDRGTTKFDIVVALSGLSICIDKFYPYSYLPEFDCDSKAIGQAYIRDACHEYKNVAIVQVNDTKSLMISYFAAAHEIAHLLGVEHDGENVEENQIGLEGLFCNPEDGFLMAPTIHLDLIKLLREGKHWSECSRKQLKHLSETNACVGTTQPTTQKYPLKDLSGLLWFFAIRDDESYLAVLSLIVSGLCYAALTIVINLWVSGIGNSTLYPEDLPSSRVAGGILVAVTIWLLKPPAVFDHIECVVAFYTFVTRVGRLSLTTELQMIVNKSVHQCYQECQELDFFANND
eukprot:GFUD01009000.1.p1 GENE.GFUD01009000.1~~GFUD01009000.1.p1  ORF type:complete len:399 (+),score=77.56 GFUD01009000.1:37-1233(+)